VGELVASRLRDRLLPTEVSAAPPPPVAGATGCCAASDKHSRGLPPVPGRSPDWWVPSSTQADDRCHARACLPWAPRRPAEAARPVLPWRPLTDTSSRPRHAHSPGRALPLSFLSPPPSACRSPLPMVVRAVRAAWVSRPTASAEALAVVFQTWVPSLTAAAEATAVFLVTRTRCSLGPPKRPGPAAGPSRLLSSRPKPPLQGPRRFHVRGVSVHTRDALPPVHTEPKPSEPKLARGEVRSDRSPLEPGLAVSSPTTMAVWLLARPKPCEG
jgi:hypothetical protein